MDEPPKPLNSYFVFEIKPFNAHESARKMRAHVDTLLQEVTKSVQRHTISLIIHDSGFGNSRD